MSRGMTLVAVIANSALLGVAILLTLMMVGYGLSRKTRICEKIEIQKNTTQCCTVDYCTCSECDQLLPACNSLNSTNKTVDCCNGYTCCEDECVHRSRRYGCVEWKCKRPIMQNACKYGCGTCTNITLSVYEPETGLSQIEETNCGRNDFACINRTTPGLYECFVLNEYGKNSHILYEKPLNDKEWQFYSIAGFFTFLFYAAFIFTFYLSISACKRKKTNMIGLQEVEMN